MKKTLSLLIFIIFVGNIAFGQDFKFSWHVSESINCSYNVKIERNAAKTYIQIQNWNTKDSIRKKIDLNDCDLLMAFLDQYDFPTKGSVMSGPSVRTYLQTKLLADTNLILVNGDTLRLASMWVRGVYFDKDSSKCYTEKQRDIAWTDGYNYEGEYIKYSDDQTAKIPCCTKRFSVYCARLSAKDIELNKMVYHLMTKYGKSGNYVRLGKLIESSIL